MERLFAVMANLNIHIHPMGNGHYIYFFQILRENFFKKYIKNKNTFLFQNFSGWNFPLRDTLISLVD